MCGLCHFQLGDIAAAKDEFRKCQDTKVEASIMMAFCEESNQAVAL
jgi:hypothetical protein